jgi:DNA polymerase-3 subunit beta
MELSLEQSDLEAALALVARAAAVRTTLPALTGVHLSAQDGELALSATDLELACRVQIPARVERPGQALLPVRYLSEYVRRVPAGSIRLEVDSATGTATLRWGRAEYTIRGFSLAEVPAVDFALGDDACRVEAEALRRALWQTGFAVSSDESKPALTGVHLRLAEGRLLAVATDGFRVAMSRCPLEAEGGELEVVVPGRAVSELIRLLAGAQDAVLSVRERQLRVGMGGVVFVTRLVDAPYPNVPALLPAQFPLRAVLEREALQQAAERLVPLAEGRQTARWLVVLELGTDRLVLRAQDPEVGQASEEVSATVEGEPLLIGLNVRYLLDALRHLEGETLEVGLIGPNEPIRLRTQEDAAGEHVIYPIRL